MSKPLHLLPGSAELEQLLNPIGALRVNAWAHDGVQVREAVAGRLLDAWDSAAEHWVVLEGDEVIGASRLTIHESGAELPDGIEAANERVAVLSRLVVAAGARGRGLGQQLTELRVQRALALGCRAVVAVTSSTHRRVASLSSLGFVCTGSSFSQVTGRPAHVLRKQLA